MNTRQPPANWFCPTALIADLICLITRHFAISLDDYYFDQSIRARFSTCWFSPIVMKIFKI